MNLLKHLLDSESHPRLAAMISLARSMLPASTLDFDTNPNLLNVQNGLLNLATGELSKHDRGAMCSRLVPIPYLPEAKCPRFDRFISEIFDGDQELITFVQRALGYSLTGDTSEQVVFIPWGSGSNGKTTLIELIARLAGGYGGTMDSNALLVPKLSGGSTPNEDLAALVGVRFAHASEFPPGAHLSPALIKRLTGGDSITTHRKYGHVFTFTPVLKPWISTNHKPVIHDTTDAMWRRVCLIPFTRKFSLDTTLFQMLLMELPGILSQLVRANLERLKYGLTFPATVQNATQTYRTEMDDIGEFLDECVIREKGASVTYRELRRCYEEYCQENNDAPLHYKPFHQRLVDHGFTLSGSKNARTWHGLKLNPVSPRSANAAPTPGE